MKKILILLIALLLLCGCAAKKEDYYNLNYDGALIVVGYDSVDMINGLDYIDSYTTYINDKEEEKLESIVIYPKDRPAIISIDDTMLNDSIESNCELLNGEMINNNGKACVIHKTVDDKENYIIMYGDILSDDIDELDRLEIYYK